MKLRHNKHRSIVIIALAIIVLTVLLFGKIASAQDRQEGSIFFYNSEININNFVSIKVMYDKYLFQYGIHFQPFDDKKIYENTFRKADLPTVMVSSSWHFQSLNKKNSLRPLLIATRNGKPFFIKVLSVKRPFRGIQSLAGKVVASAGSLEHTQSLLLKMLGKDKVDLLSSIKILNVPKDIDALLALDYNVAHAALTTQDSLKLIENINPRLNKKLRTLFTSDEILMPVAAIINSGVIGEPQKKIIQIMKEMKTSGDGRESLSALSIDGWIDVSIEIMEKLLK